MAAPKKRSERAQRAKNTKRSRAYSSSFKTHGHHHRPQWQRHLQGVRGAWLPGQQKAHPYAA
jgi:hypothetical protein